MEKKNIKGIESILVKKLYKLIEVFKELNKKYSRNLLKFKDH